MKYTLMVACTVWTVNYIIFKIASNGFHRDDVIIWIIGMGAVMFMANLWLYSILV